MATLAVCVSPKSSENRILGWSTASEGRPELLVRLTAAPTDGKANSALVKVLAKELGVPKSSISIKSGHAARHKILQIELEQTDLDRMLKNIDQ